jgi:CRP/FNR family transcriptional regulator, dissimilatory nitrate respiration regulator
MDLTAHHIIRKCFLFKNLNDEEIARVAERSRLVNFRKGILILQQGDEVPGLYCVGSGIVRVYKLAPNGKEHILHFAEPGLTFAEAAVLGGFESPAFAEAVEDTTCALLPTDQLHQLMQTEHAFCLKFVEGMSLWVRKLVGLLEDIVLRDAAGRVAGYLLRSAPKQAEQSFSLPVMKKDLASHLNLTSETLSRTLRRLAEVELIEMPTPGRVRIKNRQALEEIAEGLLPDEFA